MVRVQNFPPVGPRRRRWVARSDSGAPQTGSSMIAIFRHHWVVVARSSSRTVSSVTRFKESLSQVMSCAHGGRPPPFPRFAVAEASLTSRLDFVVIVVMWKHSLSSCKFRYSTRQGKFMWKCVSYSNCVRCSPLGQRCSVNGISIAEWWRSEWSSSLLIRGLPLGESPGGRPFVDIKVTAITRGFDNRILEAATFSINNFVSLKRV